MLRLAKVLFALLISIQSRVEGWGNITNHHVLPLVRLFVSVAWRFSVSTAPASKKPSLKTEKLHTHQKILEMWFQKLQRVSMRQTSRNRKLISRKSRIWLTPRRFLVGCERWRDIGVIKMNMTQHSSLRDVNKPLLNINILFTLKKSKSLLSYTKVEDFVPSCKF